MRVRVFLSAVLIALVATASTASAADKMPKFELKDTAGKKHTIKELFGKHDIIIFDYWQVACKPCNELLPHLEDLMKDYKKQKVGVVIISRDTALTVAQVEPFFKSHKYPFLVLLDTDLTVSNELGIKASPVTLIVNKDRDILYRHDTYKTGQEKDIEEALKAALK
jgi:cytochrome c biogenesis protein CcmG/thiol:disulfide interchange protein DsbE